MKRVIKEVVMRRLFLIVTLILISGVAMAEDPAPSIASDPRVEDAACSLDRLG